ncbi:G protein coupled receptor 4A [Elephant endotheliotropic herpesvirus 1A]|uniref:Membrane protein EE28 n=1 Tax=Elephantid herpesvirus 1 TaxID=146015 RepID=M4JX88_ELHV1|nr:membrane protein EE28 [Elephantid betaherpesvirus 1]AGE10006.1 membrane protein EE28 [Elephantid betaherpesvirus 1]QEY96088.1 membrane protein EE28 [Elephant endotheliotropic herpesvirus 1A]QYM88437.1 G protein coupled receptor 4A [Elephant endotheliotropic herpesvirus 1A]WES72464.1 G protein coupled receptor 4A [Elephantid betaherpesvirus 1]
MHTGGQQRQTQPHPDGHRNTSADDVPDAVNYTCCWLICSIMIPITLGLVCRVVWILTQRRSTPVLQLQLPFLIGLLGMFMCTMVNTKDFVPCMYVFVLFYTICTTCVLLHALYICSPQAENPFFAGVVGFLGHALVIMEYGVLDDRFSPYITLAERNMDFLLFCSYGILLDFITLGACFCSVKQPLMKGQKQFLLYATILSLILWCKFIYYTIWRSEMTWFDIVIEGSTYHGAVYLVWYALPMYLMFNHGTSNL